MLANKRCAQKSNSAYIVFVNPQTQKEKTLEISFNKSEFVIGRADSCDLVVINPVISRKHGVIKQDENGDWTIFDQSSTGTFVNKEPIRGGSKILRNEDTITLSGPYSYPFYFYLGDHFMRKKKKLSVDVRKSGHGLTGCRIKDKDNQKNKEGGDGKENKNLMKTGGSGCGRRDSSVIVLSSEEDDNNNNNNLGGDDDVLDQAREDEDVNKLRNKLEVNNQDNIVTPSPPATEFSMHNPIKQSNESDKIISSLRLQLKRLESDNFKLTEQASYDHKQYSEKIANLNKEIRVIEVRSDLNNRMIDDFKEQLDKAKEVLSDKDRELEVLKSRLALALEREASQEVLRNEVALNLKQDLMELLENELQCSICSEIILNAAVLNCTHLFCNFCIITWMKKKKECAVCRAPVKDVAKVRALDSFVDKILHKCSSDEVIAHRMQLTEERLKANDKTPTRANRAQRQGGRNSRGGRGRGEANGGLNLPGGDPLPQPMVINMALQQPNIVRMINRLGAFIPEMVPPELAQDINELNDDLIDADNDLMNELFPIVNLTNDAIDLRIDRRIRRGRRHIMRLQPRDIIDLRDSPDRD